MSIKHALLLGGLYLMGHALLFTLFNLLGWWDRPWWWTVVVGALSLPMLWFGARRGSRDE